MILTFQVRFAMEKELGGVMMWSIDIDDFSGECAMLDGEQEGSYKFQLLRSVNEAIVSSLREIEIEKEKEKERKKADLTTTEPTNRIDEPNTASTAAASSVILLALCSVFFY